MKYTAEVKVYEDPKKISNIFMPELKQPKGSRARFDMVKEKDYIAFRIKASDSVALRAVLNSITKLFTVYEKMGEL